MSREELKEIVVRIIKRMSEAGAPRPACIFSDNPQPCDATTEYGINEEG